MTLRTSCGSRATSCPATVARPPSSRSSVVRIRIAVVFPAPLGPSNPTTVASATSKSTPANGLTHARAAVLMALHREGSLTGVDLAKRFKVTPRNVTALVDALESQGLVTRQPHPLDRRAQLVAPTRAGHSMAAGMQRGYGRMTDA